MTCREVAGQRIPAFLRATALASCAALVAAGCAAGPPDAAALPGSLVAPQTHASAGGRLAVTLTAEERPVEIDGQMIGARVFNGAFAAPTLTVAPGETVEITLVNRLPRPLNLHFHGMHVSPGGTSDNVFRDTAAGQTGQYVLQIPPDHEPGLYWYHSHLHGLSEGEVFGGLSGMLVVTGLTDLLPPSLQNVQQHYLALRDFQVQGGAIPRTNIDSGAATTRVVNGQLNPSITIRPGETQLWHVANIGADIWYDIELPGHTMHVVAEDADPVWRVWEAEHLVMPPGKRFEVLIQGAAPGTYDFRTRAYDQGSAGDQYPEARLATVVSTGDRTDPLPLPTTLVPERDLRTEPVAGSRRFVFTEDDAANKFFINGKQFDPARVDADPVVGTVEEWTIVNDTDEQHPFHIHINDYQVVSVNGQPYDAKGHQDTVPVPARGEVVILNPFDDFTGKYVFHCHILAHEDLGMMGVVDVLNTAGRSEAQPVHQGHAEPPG